MVLLLLLIASYGALLLLTMPSSVDGILSTAVIFVVGIGLMIYKKFHKVTYRKCGQLVFIPVTLIVVIYLGQAFYNHWLPSSKIKMLAGMLHMPSDTMLLIGSVALSFLSAYFIDLMLQIVTKELSGQNKEYARNVASCLMAAAVTVMLAQVISDIEILSMGCPSFLWGTLIVSVVIFLLYCLFGRVIPSVLIGSGLFMLLATINAYVYGFRGRLFEPVDIFAAGTAMNVAENYSLFPIPANVLIGWGIFAAMLIVLFCLRHKNKPALTAKRRLVLLAICAVSAVAIFVYTSCMKTYHWEYQGAQTYGYILDFASKFKEMSVSKPDHYSPEAIEKLAEQYGTDRNGQDSEPSGTPHIIVIMNEAFSDLSILGEFSTNTEVTPFISSLKENTVSGYALTSVYGGNTANSEYEFLTGNSMAWLPQNTVPYSQYMRSSTYSMVSYLKQTHQYKCVAMHPYYANGWNRPNAYGYLGFDEWYFIEDYPQQNFLRNYISDQEMFEFLIKQYEAQKSDPLFFFGITMQNHGAYAYTGENFTQTITLNDCEGDFSEAEQYLSLLHATDKAVEYLITYFQNVDEDVVIVFYGDHQPRMRQSFYDAVRGAPSDDLNQQQLLYQVPFFIWANYDIEEEYVECTSLNYLSSYVYEAAAIPMPPYNRFLQALEEKIPSINANGFYSPDNGCYLPFENATEEEQKWLEMYELLQFNSSFDEDHRNETLFPVLE